MNWTKINLIHAKNSKYLHNLKSLTDQALLSIFLSLKNSDQPHWEVITRVMQTVTCFGTRSSRNTNTPKIIKIKPMLKHSEPFWKIVTRVMSQLKVS